MEAGISLPVNRDNVPFHQRGEPVPAATDDVELGVSQESLLGIDGDAQEMGLQGWAGGR